MFGAPHEGRASQGAHIESVEHVNLVLREHEENIPDWRHRELAEQIHSWVERFMVEFKLEIPTPAIRIDRIRATALGTYRPGRNGFGLKHEITINTRFLSFSLAEQLLTLLDELVHEWQDIHGSSGKRNYHIRNSAISLVCTALS